MCVWGNQHLISGGTRNLTLNRWGNQKFEIQKWGNQKIGFFLGEPDNFISGGMVLEVGDLKLHLNSSLVQCLEFLEREQGNLFTPHIQFLHL